jgi:hypothetical protein
MFKLVIFLISLFLTTSTLATTFKPIGKAKYFPPVPYSNAAMNAGKIRGAVTIGNAFAIAKIKPMSALGVAKQLAKRHPVTLAAMVAYGYFEDDIGQWMSSPESDTLTIKAPKTEIIDGVTGVTNSGFDYMVGGPLSQVDPVALCQSTFIESDLRKNVTGSWETILVVDTAKNNALTCSYDHWDNWGGPHYVQTMKPQLFIASTDTIQVKSCPPDGFQHFGIAIYGDDGQLNGCTSNEAQEATKPQPVPMDVVAETVGDGAMDKAQQADPATQTPADTWAPYVDPSTGNVDPEFISSYNVPDVSPAFNEMLKSVASGNAQTTDPLAANYVDPAMLGQTQTAVTAAMNDNPFVDPTTDSIVEPTTSTEGAATPETIPTGASDSPINITIEMPEDDTISQTEYEASNAAFFDQFRDASANSQANTDTNIEEMKTQDSDFIDSLTPDIVDAGGIPDFPSMTDLWQIGGGACIAYTSESSIAGNTRVITYDKHCPTYNSVVHPLLVWFLYVSTALYIIHLAGRTFKSTVS